MKYLTLCFLFCFFSFECSEAKILVITHSFNQPKFIEIQNQTFKKFLKDDYEFVVFNDARNDNTAQEIEYICQQERLRHIRIPQTIHTYDWRADPAKGCAEVVQYSLNILGFNHNDIVAIIDSDMFLIKEFSIRDYLNGYELAGVKQHRNDICYLWNGLLFFDMPKLPNKSSINFDCGLVEGMPCDVGGYTYYYLRDNPSIHVLPMLEQIDLFEGRYIENFYEHPDYMTDLTGDVTKFDVLNRLESHSAIWDLINAYPDNSQFFLDFSFFHYRAGTNWNNQSSEYHLKKRELLNQFIERVLSQEQG